MHSMRQESEHQMRQAIEALEEDIVLGYLHPRERLIEEDLCERFGLKRHAVRQVLLALEQMGLIERRRNVGALVKDCSIQDVLDLYEVRELLETRCASQIPMPVPAERIEALTRIQQDHDAAVRADNLRGAFRANIAFHKALFALSANAVLAEMIELAAQRAHTIRSLSMVYPHFLEQARQDHWHMIEALRVGDRDRLVSLCRKHLQPSRDAYITQARLRLHQKSPSTSYTPQHCEAL